MRFLDSFPEATYFSYPHIIWSNGTSAFMERQDLMCSRCLCDGMGSGCYQRESRFLLIPSLLTFCCLYPRPPQRLQSLLEPRGPSAFYFSLVPACRSYRWHHIQSFSFPNYHFRICHQSLCCSSFVPPLCCVMWWTQCELWINACWLSFLGTM